MDAALLQFIGNFVNFFAAEAIDNSRTAFFLDDLQNFGKTVLGFGANFVVLIGAVVAGDLDVGISQS